MASRLGELLVRRSVITKEQLATAVEQQARTGGSLAVTLVRLGFLTEETLTNYLHREYRLPVVDPQAVSPSGEVLKLIPGGLARKHQLLPLSRIGSTLTVAMADPSNLVGLSEAKFLSGLDMKVVLAAPASIQRALDRFYNRSSEAYEDALGRLDQEPIEVLRNEETVDVAALERATQDAPIVKLVNALMVDAVDKRASDIHVEPYEHDLRIRFRIDGMLHDVMEPPRRFKDALSSRIKIMAGLDIAERRLPQDGALTLRLPDGREASFRISVLPTVFGEKIVLRLLDKSNVRLGVSDLGLDARGLTLFRQAIERPYGMILVTGPTGSGKTTTLYAALSAINESYRNISTAEDPVEIHLRGVNQVQVNEEIGLTFAASLRSFLRQDPDVIMVGEIRDSETAEIAIKAALTGHLVLSTLHTNDAPSAVTRLLNMGVEPFLVSSSVNLIIAQRLVRLICSTCKERVPEVPPNALLDVGFQPEEAASIQPWHGRGCEECGDTGYRGRAPLFELMPVSDASRELMLARSSTLDLKRQVLTEGLTTLRGAGLELVRQGRTTIEEVVRVTAAD